MLTREKLQRGEGELVAENPLIGLRRRASHNPNARADHNYSVAEDLSQTPCAMSALEVLQSFPSQRKDLLIQNRIWKLDRA